MTGLGLKKLGKLFSQKALSCLSAGVAAGSFMFALGAFAKPANAFTVVGGVPLSDDGFVNRVINRTGSILTSGGTINGVVTDKSVSTYAFSISPTAFMNLGFEKPVINGLGFDIAIFDLGIPNIFRVTINNITKDFQTIFTGFQEGSPNNFNINAALVNLDDFDIAPNSFVDSIIIRLDNTTPGAGRPALALVGTVQRSVPEPSAMFGILATAGFLACQRKLKLAKKA